VTLLESILSRSSTEPFPRKGTETVGFVTYMARSISKVQQNPLPARGRKLATSALGNSAFACSGSTEPFPRKGTETFSSVRDYA